MRWVRATALPLVAVLTAAVGTAVTMHSGPTSLTVSAGSRAGLPPSVAETDAGALTTSTTTTTVTSLPVTTTVAEPPARQLTAPQPSPRPANAAALAPRPAHAGSFAFEKTNPDGGPVRFDPCAPIHVVTNLAAAPPSAAADVAEALARLSAATNVPFIIDGSTTELPSTRRPSENIDRYGHRWSPVLIAWAAASQTDILPGGLVVGEGTSSWISAGGGAPPGDDVYVTGEVAVDATTSRSLPAGFGPGITVGLLLLHELGHVVGLDHTADPTQVMSPTLAPLRSAAYGAGDLAGLRAVGTGAGCLPPPPAA